MGPTALLPFRKKGVLMIFLFALKNLTASVGFEPTKFGVLKVSTVHLDNRSR
jgi:hypothetical protein